MPRKVAFSAKKRKVQLQEKRAIKRGEVPATVAEKSKNKRKRGKRPPADNEAALAAAARTRMLVSSFLKPSPEFLEASKEAAATEILVRPIPESSRILRVGSENEGEGLVCPRRPKWRYKMTKEEVEKNEEGLFAKQCRWTTQTDEAILVFSPHLPIMNVTSKFGVNYGGIDKNDIVGEECAEAWKKWLREKYGGNGVQIVGVQSYQEVSYGIGQGSRMKYQPHMPPNLLGELQAALKRAHEALLEPPALVKEDPEKLKNWRPAVRTQVNWEAIGQKDHFQGVNIPPARDELPTDDERHDAEENDNDDAPSKEYLQDHFLTIALW
ncbi:P-loop containing nucleoside triphosphate hydrolase protein [Ceratobasidium sp. AG-Ba]|nr:P-loop containing nucleoside triphosphate hydrolase protein [Ceratobasidium sp. AG-Ba]